MFYFFCFFEKQKNIDFKKASWPKFCNIIFLFLLKIGSVCPVDQQINMFSSYNILSKNSSLKLASASDTRRSRSQMFFEMSRKYFTTFKKRLHQKCFPVKFAKFLRTLLLQNISGGCFCDKSKSVFRTLSNI